MRIREEIALCKYSKKKHLAASDVAKFPVPLVTFAEVLQAM